MVWASVINEFRQRLGLDALPTPEPVFTAFIDGLGHISLERVERREEGYAEILIVALQECPDYEQAERVAKAFNIANIDHEMQGYIPAVVGFQSQYVGFVVRVQEDHFSVQRLEHALAFLEKLLGLLDE